MEINYWTQRFQSIYESGLEKYRSGQRGAETFFDSAQTEFLASIGLKPIHVYDYVEDFLGVGEPDWNTVLLIVAARRDYFIHEMKEKWSAEIIRSADLPPKSEAYEGIDWLPRIIQKAKAFLEGALPPETMYSCGGDRKFLKTNNVHPADFLRVVWATQGDARKLADYLVKLR